MGVQSMPTASAKSSILRHAEPAFLREEGGPLAVEGASGRFRSKKPRCKQPSPWDGEGGPRERWMRRVNPLDEIQAVFIAKAAGRTFLPPLKERARRERRQAARPDRPGTVIEAVSQCNRACSQGALRQKATPCAAAKCCFESFRNRFYTTCGHTPPCFYP